MKKRFEAAVDEKSPLRNELLSGQDDDEDTLKDVMIS